MKQVAVHFPSVVELIDFVHEATVRLREVDEQSITFVGEVTQEDLDHAVNDYHATIVNGSD